LEFLFGDAPEWDIKEKNFPKERGHKLFDRFEYFTTENPCISFKTGDGLRKHSASGNTPHYSIPYWGDGKELIKKYGLKK